MKHLAFALTAGTGLVLAACGDKDDDTSTDDTSTDTQVEEEPFEPQAGTYETTNEVIEDTCNFPSDDTGMDTGGDDISTFEVGDVDVVTATFTITLENDGGTYTCSWDTNQDFTCDPLVLGTEDLSGLGMDAIVTTTGTAQGSLEVSSSAGTQKIDVTCEGADCAALADFGFNLPCSITGSFQATLQE